MKKVNKKLSTVHYILLSILIFLMFAIREFTGNLLVQMIIIGIVGACLGSIVFFTNKRNKKIGLNFSKFGLIFLLLLVFFVGKTFFSNLGPTYDERTSDFDGFWETNSEGDGFKLSMEFFLDSVKFGHSEFPVELNYQTIFENGKLKLADQGINRFEWTIRKKNEEYFVLSDSIEELKFFKAVR